MSGSEMGFRPFDPESSFFSYPTSLHIGENRKQFSTFLKCHVCYVVEWSGLIGLGTMLNFVVSECRVFRLTCLFLCDFWQRSSLQVSYVLTERRLSIDRRNCRLSDGRFSAGRRSMLTRAKYMSFTLIYITSKTVNPKVYLCFLHVR